MDFEELTYRDLFRHNPVQSGLFTVGPIVLAIAQLANTGPDAFTLPFGLAFALVMLVFSVFFTRYHLVEFRLRELQRTLEW